MSIINNKKTTRHIIIGFFILMILISVFLVFSRSARASWIETPPSSVFTCNVSLNPCQPCNSVSPGSGPYANMVFIPKDRTNSPSVNNCASYSIDYNDAGEGFTIDCLGINKCPTGWQNPFCTTWWANCDASSCNDVGPWGPNTTFLGWDVTQYCSACTLDWHVDFHADWYDNINDFCPNGCACVGGDPAGDIVGHNDASNYYNVWLTPTAPTQPSVTKPVCSDSVYSITISWQGHPGTGYWVDIDNDADWNNGFWNKFVDGRCGTIGGTSSTTAPTGFTGLTLNPGTTYRVRVWNGYYYSPIQSFTVPCCTSCVAGSKICFGDASLTCGSCDADPCPDWCNPYNCNNDDGWYCNGNIREYRDYSCTGAGNCTYIVTSSTDCGAAQYFCSGDDVMYNPGCISGACGSNTLQCTCSDIIGSKYCYDCADDDAVCEVRHDITNRTCHSPPTAPISCTVGSNDCDNVSTSFVTDAVCSSAYTCDNNTTIRRTCTAISDITCSDSWVHNICSGWGVWSCSGGNTPTRSGQFCLAGFSTCQSQTENGSCGSWLDGACGVGGCAANERQQTRICVPSGVCPESRCIADPTCIPSTCDTSFPNNYFHACYYTGINFDTFKANEDEPTVLTSPVPVDTSSNPPIDHYWNTGEVNATDGGDFVSAVWRGAFNFPAGDYIFKVNTDDGVRLDIGNNGSWEIDHWSDTPWPTELSSGNIFLNGSVSLKLEWYENGGQAGIRLWWEPNNSPNPPVNIDVSFNNCTNPPTMYPVFSWDYSDSENDNQRAFQIQVANDSGFGDIIYDSCGYGGTDSCVMGFSNCAGPRCSYTPQNGIPILDYSMTYYMRVRANDGIGGWSDWSDDGIAGWSDDTFDTDPHGWPRVSFSLSPSKPFINETIRFTSTSTCYRGGDGKASQPCANTPGVLYLWGFGDGSSDSGNPVSHSYNKAGNYMVNLLVIDGSTSCYSQDDVLVKASFIIPEWREIFPR